MAGAAAQLAACLPLPSLVSGQVTTQPLLTRLSGQLGAIGIRDIILIAPVGRGDTLRAMAWEGLYLAGVGLAAGNIEVIECASIAAELRAVAAVTRRLSRSGNTVLICAGDLVAHTEALDCLHRSVGTAALTAANGSRAWRQDPTCGPRFASAARVAAAGQPRARWRVGGAWGSAGGAVPASRTEAGFGVRRAVVAAGSAFHRVHAPDAVGCGVFVVAADDGDELAAAADKLPGLAARRSDR